MKFIAIFSSLILVSSAAMAMDLQSARSSGNVCEQSDGYAAATGGNAEVKALVAEVNAKRKMEYQKISAQNGQTVAVVGQLASKQIGSQPGVKACN